MAKMKKRSTKKIRATIRRQLSYVRRDLKYMDSLKKAEERYRKRTGHYPMRILADQIYQTRDNRKFCKEHGIRLSGPKLGRPSETAKQDKETEYQDNVDRIGVERAFSICKRCYGMGLILHKS